MQNSKLIALATRVFILKSREVVYQVAVTHLIVFWCIMPGDFLPGEGWNFIFIHYRGLRHVELAGCLVVKEDYWYEHCTRIFW
jgi:hypothetical protein